MGYYHFASALINYIEKKKKKQNKATKKKYKTVFF